MGLLLLESPSVHREPSVGAMLSPSTGKRLGDTKGRGYAFT